MLFQSISGTAIHQPTAFETGMLEDMGWALSADGFSATPVGSSAQLLVSGGGLDARGVTAPLLACTLLLKIATATEAAGNKPSSLPDKANGLTIAELRATVSPIQLAGQVTERPFATALDSHSTETGNWSANTPSRALDGWFTSQARSPLLRSLSDWEIGREHV